MRLKPQGPSSDKWIDSGFAPPFGFIAIAVELTMMAAAQRDGELVADLAPKRTTLREAEVMRIARFSATDQAGLLSDMPDVLAIPHPARLRNDKALLSIDFDCFGFLALRPFGWADASDGVPPISMPAPSPS